MNSKIYKLEGNANLSMDCQTIYVDIKISSLSTSCEELQRKDIANIISLALQKVNSKKECNNVSLSNNIVSFGKISIEYPIKKNIPSFIKNKQESIYNINENDQMLANIIAGTIKVLSKKDANLVPYILSTIMKLQNLNKNLLSYDLEKSRQSLSKWLHGKAKISDKNLIKLASLIVPEVKVALKKINNISKKDK